MDQVRGRREGEAQIAIGDIGQAGLLGDIDHFRVATTGVVDPIAVSELGQEVVDVVMAGQIDQHVVHQLVRAYFLDQGGDGAAERIGVGEAGVEFDEAASERGFHDPAPDLGALARDVAEVQQQALAEHLVANIAAQDAEVDQQALAVLDDLGLGRFDGGLG